MNKRLFISELKKEQLDGSDIVGAYNIISSVAMRCALKEIPVKPRHCAHYFSIEYLMGRGFYNNLMELGVLHEVASVLAEKGIDINAFEEVEDAALGNGGLGRLAACFLDSAAALGLPLYGYGIRYKYGLFKQDFENGFQKELPDDWQRFGDPWSIRKEDESKTITFADMVVTAVPYDMPVFGKRINILRLYQVEGSTEAEKISEYLYPADDTEDGKILRLRQEYFFTAAACRDIVKNFVRLHGTNFKNLGKYNTIQLNDTHPVLAIAELIRIMTAEYGVKFETALGVVKSTFAYTNHTILPEALECWDMGMIERILPEIAQIISKVDDAARIEREKAGYSADEIERTAVIRGNRAHMANLAVYASKSVNGVAKLHTEIIERDVFPTEYKYHPEKFSNKTNGVTQRRWLMLCNEELSSLIDKTIGREWRNDFTGIFALKENIGDIADKFIAVKGKKKRQLFDYIRAAEGIDIPENMILYAQVKRLHEYKRQLMTAFAILEIYNKLKRGELKDFQPSVFLFGAKSAPSYRCAKAIIKFINCIAEKINADEQTNGLLKVVFVRNYNVSYAEKIVAAADVSLQVSTAGFEASGTGNMKFMMNGAVTCGTLDGANIEIVDYAGEGNNYIFGATAEEIKSLSSGGYSPQKIYDEDEELHAVVDTLTDGTFDDCGTGDFADLYASLLKGERPDYYFVLYDLNSYVETLLTINEDYKNRVEFAKKQLNNTANSAYFSSDRTIKEYARDIWKI